MKTVDVSELSTVNFNPIFINALRQFWKNGRSFQCIGFPKKQNLLLYLNGCKATYTMKNGDVFTAESGDVVYCPLGSEYRAEFSEFQTAESSTIGINFLLTDEAGEPVVMSDTVKIFRVHDSLSATALFDKATMGKQWEPSIANRIILLEILSLLAYIPPSRDTSIISKAIDYLRENIEKNPPISEVAKYCNVSEVYLRKKFNEKMHTSPVKYRNRLRLNMATTYLEFGEISVQEISDTLGYSTVSHFIKEFRRHTGISPLQYRNKTSRKSKAT